MSLDNYHKNRNFDQQPIYDSEDSAKSLLRPITADKVTIGEFLAGIKRRWKPATILGIATALLYLGYYYLFLRSYQHTISLQVEAIRPLGGRPVTSIDSIRGVIQSIPSLPVLSGETTGDTTTLLQILNSDLVLRPLYDKFLERNPDLNSENYTYESFRRSLLIEAPNNSRRFSNNANAKVIQVTFVTNNKNELKAALNLISEELTQFNEAEKRERIFQNLRYINQEIQRTLNQIDDLEDQLNQFRAENQVLRPDSVGSFSAGGMIGAGGAVILTSIECNWPI